MAAINSCIEGQEGKDLMLESARAVKQASVQRSCTVVIDGAKRCIRDGGRWYDCPGGSSEAEFVASLCAAHTAKTGAAAPPQGCPPAAAAGAPGKGG